MCRHRAHQGAAVWSRLRALVGMVTSDVAKSTAYTGAQGRPFALSNRHPAGICRRHCDDTRRHRPATSTRCTDVAWLLEPDPQPSPLYLTATFDVIYARRDIAGRVPWPDGRGSLDDGRPRGLGSLPPWGARERAGDACCWTCDLAAPGVSMATAAAHPARRGRTRHRHGLAVPPAVYP